MLGDPANGAAARWLRQERERLAAEARPAHDPSGVLSPDLEPEGRGVNDPQPLRAERAQHQADNGRVEFEPTGCAVARVDS